MKLKALIHPAEEGGYWAEVPALPGCVSEGDTFEETLANIREAMEGWLDVAAERLPVEKDRDPMPHQFVSEEEAADFWDTHSLADYEDFLEPVDVEVDLRKRHFEIEVDERTFQDLVVRAKETHVPVRDLVNRILNRGLVSDLA